ncbi:MAG: hypothetical protein C9356_12270 [Oleiphilus sp.]|nr:MAG: hypothetical protein C9356_12270 [Oleiphilus sp.]
MLKLLSAIFFFSFGSITTHLIVDADWETVGRQKALQTALEDIDVKFDHLTQRYAALPVAEYQELFAVGGPIAPHSEKTREIDSLQAMLDLVKANLDTHKSVAHDNSDIEYISGFPVSKGWISSPFGNRVDPFTNRKGFHRGIDIAATSGMEVISTSAGRIIFAGVKPGYGTMVDISFSTESGEYRIKYAHLSELTVETGQNIEKGDLLGYVGSTGRSTGSHLHYEIIKDGEPVDPLIYAQR